MHRFVHPLVLCSFGSLLLCGCGRHDAPPPAPKPAAAHTAATPANKPAAAVAPAASAARPAAIPDTAFHVASLTLGSAIDANSYAVTAPAVRFDAGTPTIYASVATEGRTAGATLAARWRYLEGPGVLVNEIKQSVAADGPAVTTFKVQNPNRWPAGKYDVQITLDGKPVAQQGFEVNGGQ